jgi:outer membrane receptor protein involved in Fe transport
MPRCRSAKPCFSASYFDRDFRYEADATDYEFRFNQNEVCYDTTTTDTGRLRAAPVVYDFGGDPRARDEPRGDQITTLEAGCSRRATARAAWSWLVGAFYEQEKGKTEFNSYIRGYANTIVRILQTTSHYLTAIACRHRPWFLGKYDTELDQVAVFGELTFDITDQFSITAGGRWFDYDRKFAQIQEQPEGFTGSRGSTAARRQRGRHGRQAEPDVSLRPGSPGLCDVLGRLPRRRQQPAQAASLLPRDYKSDQLKNYEIGAKTEWLRQPVRFNYRRLLHEVEDFAVQIEDPQPGVFQLGSSTCRARDIPGVEARFRPDAGRRVADRGVFLVERRADGAGDTSVCHRRSGHDLRVLGPDGARLPLDARLDGGARDRVPVGGALVQRTGTAVCALRCLVHRRVRQLAGGHRVRRLGQRPQTQDSYTTGDLRFGLESESWSASLYVNNVWNEYAELFFSNRWGNSEPIGGWHGGQRVSVLAPRTIGLQLRFNF